MVWHIQKDPLNQQEHRTPTLLLDRRSIDISGAREKEGHFHYKNFHYKN